MFYKLSVLLLFVSVLTAQTVVTVHMGTDADSMKNLCGVNRGPMATHVLGYKEAGITTIRMQGYYGVNDYVWYTNFWNFDESSNSFTTINTTFDPDNPADYQWDDFDSKVNYIINHGYEPYIRLGISYPREPYIIQPNDPPLDEDGIHFTKFARMAKRTIMHYNDGWDNGYHYGIRYWEIWNEPDGVFWSGTPQQFYKFFQTVAETLRAYNPDLVLGGPAVTPATTIGATDTYLDRFLDYLHDNDVPLDFYSWHLYEIRNPYMLEVFAQNIRQKLDERGFTGTESHITEINHKLSGDDAYLDDSAKGAAFYASLLIAAQKSPVDRLFWFPGDGFFFDDSAGQGHLKWGTYPIAYFSEMRRETPVQVQTEGDVVLADFWDVDTTNFMSLAARSADGEKLAVLISNYNSNIDRYTVRIHDHPWQTGDTLLVTQKISREPNDRFTTVQFKMVVQKPLTLDISDMPAPSVLYLKLQRVATTGLAPEFGFLPEKNCLLPNFPNPFNPTTTVQFALKQSGHVVLDVFGVRGQKMATLIDRPLPAGVHALKIDASGWASGVYFYRLLVVRHGQVVFQRSRKMVVLK